MDQGRTPRRRYQKLGHGFLNNNVPGGQRVRHISGIGPIPIAVAKNETRLLRTGRFRNSGVLEESNRRSFYGYNIETLC